MIVIILYVTYDREVIVLIEVIIVDKKIKKKNIIHKNIEKKSIYQSNNRVCYSTFGSLCLYTVAHECIHIPLSAGQADISTEARHVDDVLIAS